MQDKDIKPAYKHSKIGNFMFFICAKATKLLIKARPLYYLLACIWGIILTFIGIVITIVLGVARIFNKNIHFEKYYWIYDIKAGPTYWGGFEMGLMFVRDQKSITTVNAHEFGHTFQNCLLGPLMPFVVSLPSAIRYWIIYFKYDRKGLTCPYEYDSIWFEDAATQCGNYAVHYLETKQEVKYLLKK